MPVANGRSQRWRYQWELDEGSRTPSRVDHGQQAWVEVAKPMLSPYGCHLNTPPTPPLPPQVHPLFATIYNSIYFLANAVEATRRTGRWVMGTSVAEHARGFQLEGFCQPFSVNEDGDVSVPYVVLDTDGKGDRLWPVYGLEPGTRGLGYRGHSVHWPHGSSPGTDSGCWFESGSICNGGKRGAPSLHCVCLSGWVRVGLLVSLSELS